MMLKGADGPPNFRPYVAIQLCLRHIEAKKGSVCHRNTRIPVILVIKRFWLPCARYSAVYYLDGLRLYQYSYCSEEMPTAGHYCFR